MTWLAVLVLVPVALVVLVACLRQPMRFALPLYAGLIPFGKALSFGGSSYGSASSLAGMALTLGLLLHIVSGRPLARRLPLSVALWLVFLGVALATSLWTLNRGETWSGLAVLSSLVLVYALASVVDVDRTVVRRVENGLMVGSVAAVCYGVYQLAVLGGFLSDTPGEVAQTDGRFGNGMLGPNIESVTLLLPLVIALHRACTDPGRRSRLLATVTAVLMLLGILMTGSRTGTLGAGLVVLALLVVSPPRARPVLFGSLAAGAILATVVWVGHPFGLAERTYATATSSSGRVEIWEVGLAACGRYCLGGSGWGTFPDVYAATQALVPGARVLAGDQGSYQPHNLWLLTVIETGFLGMLLFTTGLALAMRDAVRLPMSFRGPAVAGLLALVFGVFFLSSMEFKIFWMVLLLVNLYRNAAAHEAESGRQPPVTIPATLEPVARSGP